MMLAPAMTLHDSRKSERMGCEAGVPKVKHPTVSSKRLHDRVMLAPPRSRNILNWYNSFRGKVKPLVASIFREDVY
jgi:hypothetical protein